MIKLNMMGDPSYNANIDGLLEYWILNTMRHMRIYAQASHLNRNRDADAA